MLTQFKLVSRIEVQGIVLGFFLIDGISIDTAGRQFLHSQLYIGIFHQAGIIVILVIFLVEGIFCHDVPILQRLDDGFHLNTWNRITSRRCRRYQIRVSWRVNDIILIFTQDFTRHIAFRIPADQTGSKRVTDVARQSRTLGIGIIHGDFLCIPLGDVCRDESRECLTGKLILIGNHRTVFIRVVGRNTETEFVCTTGYTKIVITQDTGIEGIALWVAFLQVIHRTIRVLVNTVFVYTLQCTCIVLLEEFAPGCNLSVTCPVLLGITGFFVCIDVIHKRSLFRTADRFFPTLVEAIVELELGIVFRTLGSYEDNTTCCTCSVNSCRSRILQNGYTFDIIRIQGTEITFHVVNQYQWSTTVDGQVTTDVEALALTR